MSSDNGRNFASHERMIFRRGERWHPCLVRPWLVTGEDVNIPMVVCMSSDNRNNRPEVFVSLNKILLLTHSLPHIKTCAREKHLHART